MISLELEIMCQEKDASAPKATEIKRESETTEVSIWAFLPQPLLDSVNTVKSRYKTP